MPYFILHALITFNPQRPNNPLNEAYFLLCYGMNRIEPCHKRTDRKAQLLLLFILSHQKQLASTVWECSYLSAEFLGDSLAPFAGDGVRFHLSREISTMDQEAGVE